MFNVIPPVGVRFSWGYIFSPGIAGTQDFRQALATLLGGEIYFSSSGKSALYLILEAMKACRPDRDEVILPDYTCWTVPSAVVRAGLKVKPADIDPATLGLSPDSLPSLINHKTLAVIAAHHFGLPSDIEAVEKLCHDRAIFLIDDAAQGLGATVGGRALGSFGDAGVLSFGRGKIISTLAGGAATIKNRDIKTAADKIYSEKFTTRAGGPGDTLQLTAYKLLFPSWLYWIPDSLPFLKLGETVYDPNFDLAGLSPARQQRGAWMISRMNIINQNRSQIAEIYYRELTGIAGLALPVLPPKALAVFLRFPLLIHNPLARTEILRRGHRFGISKMYPDVVSSIAGLKPHLAPDAVPGLNAAMVANSLVTLPTHHGIKPADARAVAGFLRDILAITPAKASGQ